MRRLLAAILLCLMTTPAVADVSSGKEFVRSGVIELRHKGKTYRGYATIRVTARNERAARALAGHPKTGGPSIKRQARSVSAGHVAPDKHAIVADAGPVYREQSQRDAAAPVRGGTYHQWGSSPLVDRARSYMGMTASQIGLHRTTLWCAAFLNHITGGGTGSDLARSYARYGRPVHGPQVGAIAVMARGRRGGHVGIVSGVDGRGNPIIISGNHNRRVAESVYPRGRVYAYRMP